MPNIENGSKPISEPVDICNLEDSSIDPWSYDYEDEELIEYPKLQASHRHESGIPTSGLSSTFSELALERLRQAVPELVNETLVLVETSWPISEACDIVMQNSIRQGDQVPLSPERARIVELARNEEYFKNWDFEAIGDISMIERFSWPDDREDGRANPLLEPERGLESLSTLLYRGIFRISGPESDKSIYLVGQSLMYPSDGTEIANRFLVYRREDQNLWRQFRDLCLDITKRIRTRDTRNSELIILNDDLSLPIDLNCRWEDMEKGPELQGLHDDFHFFIQRSSWFLENKIPMTRGYLLVGPPGNGKSLAARAMATTPRFKAYTFDFGNPRTSTNYYLQKAFNTASRNAPSIFILEDIDRVFEKNEDPRGVSKEALLSCLDGITSNRGVIIVATANHPELLDEALLHRPGRFDRVIRIGNPDLGLRESFLHRLFDNCTNCNVSAEIIAELAAKTEDCSMVFLREILIAAASDTFTNGGENIEDENALKALDIVMKQFSDTERRNAGFKRKKVGFGG